MPLKILISGDVHGKLPDLYKKVSMLEKKNGKFDLLFCVGDFFGYDSSFIDEYKSKQRVATIETYVICPLKADLKHDIDKNGCQIAENIIYVGSKGFMELNNKLRVAFLSLTELDVDSVNDLVQRLKCTGIGYVGVDLLFTNCWPLNVEKNCSKVPKNQIVANEYSSELCAALASLVQPRYHFVGCSEEFYERDPYKNQKPDQFKSKHVTRFISLGSVKNSCDEKYIYAVNISPLSTMTSESILNIPKSATENPFCDIKPHDILSKQGKQFFFDTPANRKRKDMENENQLDNNDVKKSKKVVAEGCWFCLGNPQVEKHLIVHVGQETYIAMPRGPLVNQHLMIITIGHFQSLVATPVDVFKEIKFMMKTIKTFFAQQNLSVVFFERNFKTNHFQMQAVPIPTDKLESCKQLFIKMAADNSGPTDKFREIPSRSNLFEIVKAGIPYVYVELSNGEKLFGTLDKNRLTSFDLQFARCVLSHADVLNCPEKVQWKDCTESESVEEEMTKKLEKAMEAFF